MSSDDLPEKLRRVTQGYMVEETGEKFAKQSRRIANAAADMIDSLREQLELVDKLIDALQSADPYTGRGCDEADVLLKAWRAAREQENGSTCQPK